MSTLKTTNLQHPSAGSPAIVLDADGDATYAGVHDFSAATVTGASVVVQVVNSVLSTLNIGNASSTYINTGLSATITPRFSDSKILVMVTHNGIYKGNVNNTSVNIKLLRNSTDLILFAKQTAYNNSNNQQQVGGVGVNYLDSPATTSAVTYKTMFASAQNLATAYINNEGQSTMTLMEVRP